MVVAQQTKRNTACIKSVAEGGSGFVACAGLVAWRIILLATLLGGILGVFTPPAVAQDSPPLVSQPGAQRPTKESIEAAKAAIDAVTDLDDAAKAKAKENYDNALKALQATDDAEKAAQNYAGLLAKIEQDGRTLQTQVENPPGTVTVEAPPNVPLSELQQKLTEAQQAATEKTAALEKVKADRMARQARRTEIPKLVTQANEQLTRLDVDLAAPPPDGESAGVTASRRALLVAQRLQAQAVKNQLEKELAYYEAASNASIPANQQKVLERQVAIAQDTLEQWDAIVTKKRQEDADDKISGAYQLINNVAEPLKEIARERVLESALARQELAKNLRFFNEKKTETQKLTTDLTSEYDAITDTVDKAGLTEPVGLKLRQTRDKLPSIGELEQLQQEASRESRAVTLKQFDVAERLEDLADPETVASDMVAANSNITEEMKPQLAEILNLEKDYLEVLDREYEEYLNDLVDLDTNTAQVIAKIEEYQHFIDERVLWIRSTQLPGWDDLRYASAAGRWLFLRPRTWGDLILALGWDALQNPIPALLAILVFGAWIISRKNTRSKLKEIGRKTARGSSQTFSPTLQSILLTFLLAGLFPAILAYLAWRMRALEYSAEVAGDPVRTSNMVELAHAVANGLGVVALLLVVLELWRQVCRNDGLAEAHFQWSSRALARLRSSLYLLNFTVLPLAFVYATIAALDNDRWHNSLGRFCFSTILLMIMVFMHRVLNVEQGIFREHFSYRAESWIARLKYFWWIAGITAPALMLLATISGFFYTSEHLARHWFSTLAFLSGLLLVSATLRRWIVVNRRRLAIQRARELRAAAQAALEAGGSSSEEAAASVPVAETEVDLSKIDMQTRRLIRSVLMVAAFAGVWLIWVNVLPALGILDSVTLWDTTEVVTQQRLSPDAKASDVPSFETVERIKPVTLGNVVIALVLALIVFVAATNFPGVLEMVLLQRLPLQHGVRYAITTVARYVILIIGVLLCSSQIGIGWENVQWLVAALSLGLGFGLQEIFANFVSGLIILFERPVRLGDVVTVGDVSGVVSRIRIRATTITDWDRKEYVVPNKEFVTGRVLNWTLTDTVTRVIIRVGVAYGSNTEQVRTLLLKIAGEHANVLDDPPPLATFEGFGDSTLDFVLRAYLPSLENRLQTTHDLHMRIDAEFRQAGIEIAFPQRDLHIRTQDAPLLFETDHGNSSASSNGKHHQSENAPREAT